MGRMEKRSRQLYDGTGREGKGLMQEAMLELSTEKWEGFHWIHQWKDDPGRRSTVAKGSS